MVCRFLKAGVSGGAERAQLVAEIEAKEGVGAPCICRLLASVPVGSSQLPVCASKPAGSVWC